MKGRIGGREVCFVAALALRCSDSSDAKRFVVDSDPRHRTPSGSMASTGGSHAGGAPESGGRSGAPDAGPDTSDAAVGGAGGGSGGAARSDGSPGTDAGADVVQPDKGPGVLVAYDIRSTEKTLTVLDPETGRPLSSETIGTVRAIVNDGAPYPKDRWYVFEQTGPADLGVTIRVRNLDAGTGVFQELGALQNAPTIFGRPITFGAGGKSFVAYLSESTSAKADLALTVLDATYPANPRILPMTGAAFPSASRIGLVADGDSLAIVTVQVTPCPVGPSGRQECNVSLTRATVTTSAVVVGSAIVVDKTGPTGNVDVAMDPLRHESVFGLPPVSTPSSPTCSAASRSTGTVRTYSMSTGALGSSVSIPMEAPRLSGAAFDACSRVAFLTTLADDVAIWAVPVAAGSVATKLCVGAPGGSLFYEHSSHSLFRASVTGEIEAYRVETSGSSPNLTARSLSELPPGIRAGALAVRSPKNPSCP